MDFTDQLLLWYQENHRELPWRKTVNPYYIWLSEVILQQTRVEQGLPYYEAFVRRFPELKDLALADEDEVLKIWQGLGYYSRARNLHYSAKTIFFELDNQFPSRYKEIIQLKGIGPYTAAAIASFAFKEVIGVVDGNVFRFLSRFYGIFEDIAVAKTRTIFQNLVNELISEKHPDLFNQALMDFGALICVPVNPKCEVCPFQNQCFAFQNREILKLPVKNKKNTVKNRYFHFMILKNHEKVVLQQRLSKDIWHRLYQFPVLETKNDNEEEAWQKLLDLHPTSAIKKLTTNTIKHKLSHQHLHINFYEIDGKHLKTNEGFVEIATLNQYAFPIVLWNFIKDHFKLKKN